MLLLPRQENPGGTIGRLARPTDSDARASQQPGGFVVGAATPCTMLKADKALAAAWPGVVEAANLIGSVQVRNRATMANTSSWLPTSKRSGAS